MVEKLEDLVEDEAEEMREYLEAKDKGDVEYIPQRLGRKDKPIAIAILYRVKLKNAERLLKLNEKNYSSKDLQRGEILCC